MMGKALLLVALTLILAFLPPDLPARASLTVHAAPSPPVFVRKPRTYEIWSCDAGSNATALLTIGGEQEALLVVGLEEPESGWRIIGLDVSNGSIVAEARISSGIGALAAVGSFLAVATDEALLVLNASLGLSHELSWPAEEVSFFQALSDEELVYVREKTASCFSVGEMRVKWSFSFEEAEEIHACVLPGEGVAILRLEGGTWRGCLLWSNGTRGTDVDVLWLDWARGVELSSFNTTHFLLSSWNETYRGLSLVRSHGFYPSWTIELGPDGREGPFVLPDLDGDRAPEVLTWCAGRYRVLSGNEGSELYQFLGLDHVGSVVWVGKRLLAILGEGAVRLVELGRMSGEARWLWEEEASSICGLPDLDGDGIGELAIVLGTNISCIWGSYDDELPTISDLWPEDGLSTSFTSIALVARISDEQSGLRRVVFKVDGEAVPCSFDEGRGLYVADVRLGEGVHVWCVEAEDRVGYVAVSEARKLVVNLSFFGGPGWLDDVAFFSPWVIVLSAGGIILLKMARRQKEAQSPSTAT